MIELSVRDVRAALAGALRPEDRGAGELVTALLGRIFHQVFADLVGQDPERSGLRALFESGPSDEQRTSALTEHAWTKLLAPRLLRHAAELHTTTEAVSTLWRGTLALCTWLCSVSQTLRQAAERSGDLDVSPWERMTSLLRAEVPVECVLQEPGWTEPVRLVGVADSLLRVPGRDAVCAIEIKLGRAAPPVDLGQVALYRLILVRSGAQSEGTAMALLHFSPDLEERLFEAPDLDEAQARLLDLIGALAGVVAAPTPIAADPPAAGVVSPPTASSEPNTGHVELGKRLVRACRAQGANIEVRGQPVVGARFLRFEVRLSPGSRLDALRRRMPEVGLHLQLTQEPIVTASAGSLYIDVARPDPEILSFEQIARSLPRGDRLFGSARLPIGGDSSGKLRTVDLASPGRSHVLVAGTSGSGKSEWLRAALAGLLLTNTPDTLRVVTMDPKLNAFNDMEGSPFLRSPEAFWVPGTDNEAADVFEDLIEEMEQRYQLTRQTGSDNLAEHIRKTGRSLPRIVCFCDEYMALVTTSREAKRRIEDAVSLLGAKARAAGIHLILATQQPSRNVVTGTIQANLTCRVALTLTSHIESNMILGTSGAERLTGAGDLLYKDFGDPERLQAPLLSAEQRRRIFQSGEATRA